MRLSAAVLSLLLGIVATLNAAEPTSNVVTQEKIAQLVKQLGSDSYREREAAAKELDFIQAAIHRDEMNALKKKLK